MFIFYASLDLNCSAGREVLNLVYQFSAAHGFFLTLMLKLLPLLYQGIFLHWCVLAGINCLVKQVRCTFFAVINASLE